MLERGSLGFYFTYLFAKAAWLGHARLVDGLPPSHCGRVRVRVSETHGVFYCLRFGLAVADSRSVGACKQYFSAAMFSL